MKPITDEATKQSALSFMEFSADKILKYNKYCCASVHVQVSFLLLQPRCIVFGSLRHSNAAGT